MKRITEYADCEVFKPGELWRSPRGTLFHVESSAPNRAALLRPFPRSSGRRRYVPWDGVEGWTREAARDE